MSKQTLVRKIGFLSILWLCTFISVTTLQAAPGGIDRQIPVTGRLVNSSGVVVEDGTYRVRLRLFDSESGGVQLFEELFDGSSNYGSGICPEIPIKNGEFRVDMGACNVITTAAYQSLFNNTELHLEIAMDINEDSVFEEVFDPRKKLTLAMGAVSTLQLVSNGVGTSSNTLGIDDQGHLRLNGVGRFGIGIGGGVPQSSIQVNDSGITSRTHLYGTGDGTNYSEFRLGRNTQNSESWNLLHRQIGGQNGNFAIEEFDGGNTNQRLVVNPGGNIGVGATTADARLHIEGSSGGIFDALRITNSALNGSSIISFEESNQGQNFSIRYRGDQNQLEFVGLGGNEAFEIEASNGDVFSQGNANVGVDYDITGELIVFGSDIRSASGNLDIFTSGNNDIELEPGLGADVKFILSDNGGTNVDCFELTNDAVSRIAYNCINNELEFRNSGEFSVNAPWLMNDFLLLTTTDTDTCDFPFPTPLPYPGVLISDENLCGNSGLGAASIIDGNEVLGWGEGLTWDFLVDYQGVAESKSIFDTTNTTYQVTQAGQSRFNNFVTTAGLYPGGTNYSFWIDNAGSTRATANEIINNATSITYHQDTDHRSAMTYVNANYWYVLRGCAVNATTWCPSGAYWPMYIHLETNNAVLGGNAFVAGVLSKTSGTFDIKHPNPDLQAAGWRLRHSFVEGPTRGDNIYRFEATVQNGIATLELPDYYKYLNENSQVWVSPIDNFGSGTGIVDQQLEKVDIQADQDGTYSILVIGTRKDEDAKVFDEKGVEYQGEVSSAPLVSP